MKTADAGFPGDAQLKDWAGEAAWQRGRGYHRDGLVHLAQVTETTLAGEAHGSETYDLWLRRKGKTWQWHCDCPAADDGVFCEHLVAAVLTARDGSAEEGESQPAVGSGKSKSEDLLQFLHVQPAERLAVWLHELARSDRDVEKRLLLYRAAEPPGALKTALGKLLGTGGFLDYRGAIRYASRLDAAIPQLRDVLHRDPAECRASCEYVLKRLMRVYGNADDSAGAIGECLREVAELHAEACVATKPGKALVKTLYELKVTDEWGLFPLDGYWDALTPAGQSDYGKRVLAEFEKLPAQAKPGDRFGDSFGACRRTEELARCAGDFELLQRVLRRDLSHDWDWFRVLESLREFGRGREALAWAENAVKKFPGDSRLRAALAECLAEAGMLDEALEQTWQNFVGHPIDENWDALKHMAGRQWPAWRARALEAVATHEASHEKGVASMRINLLLHDGDLEAAVTLARANPVGQHVLHGLADAASDTFPEDAGRFYLRLAQAHAQRLNGAGDYQRLVDCLHPAAKLLSAAEWQPLVQQVREANARKPKLMGMLDKAGL